MKAQRFTSLPTSSSSCAYGQSVAECDSYIRAGFLRKVFGLVGAQLTATVLVASIMMFVQPVRDFALSTPSIMLATFLSSLGFLIACSVYKDSHPKNLYLLAGFTLSMAYSVGMTCAVYAAHGMGLLVLEAVALTASVTLALTVYTLRSKTDFSYMGAGLGSALWVLILGSLLASLTGASAMHFALSVGGALVFALYIVYDVSLIAQRLSPDEYVSAAISLYLDIINLFLHILRILAELQGRD